MIDKIMIVVLNSEIVTNFKKMVQKIDFNAILAELSEFKELQINPRAQKAIKTQLENFIHLLQLNLENLESLVASHLKNSQKST